MLVSSRFPQPQGVGGGGLGVGEEVLTQSFFCEPEFGESGN